eukprot:m.191945 g.191945  ORF g.191945 m.191945 type:complete len:865 (+) comp17578_c0_seq2:212-2806(+)
MPSELDGRSLGRAAGRMSQSLKEGPHARSVENLAAPPEVDNDISRQRSGRRYSKATQGEESFRVEDGTKQPLADRQALSDNILLENPEAETRWYFKYFLGEHHENHIAYLHNPDEEDGHELVVLSILFETNKASGVESKQIRAILWRKTGSEHLVLPVKGKMPDAKRVLLEFGVGIPEKKMEEIKDANVQNDLLILEEQEGAINFKFGVLYARANQRTDDEMFSNEHGSPAFEEFLELLGTQVRLKGWNGFRGGLDVKNGSTGEKSVHTVEFGKEIMFHVSTYLPYSKDNSQQLERKRHLGNDICNIIFQEDSDTPFFPEMIKSKFNHIFALVSRDKKTGHYSLKVYTKRSVPEYGPPLPNPCIFPDKSEFRHFLIVKLMNAEKAALSSPTSSFAGKKLRTLDALLNQINLKYSRDGQKQSGKSSSSSKKTPVESFRTIGQEIKVGKIAAGVAPTSTYSESGKAAVTMSEPWAPVCITTEFTQQILCGDSWDNNLVVSTPEGVTLITVAPHMPGQLATRKLFDASVRCLQLRVDEVSCTLFLCTLKFEEDDRKRGSVYAVPFEALRLLERPMSKKELKPYLVPNAKECHLFAINYEGDLSKTSTRLLVAIGKKVRRYSYVLRNPGNVPGMGSGGVFTALGELPMNEPVDVMSITGQPARELICLGFKSGDFVTHSVETGSMNNAHSANMKVEPVIFTETSPGDEELMVAYNQQCLFRLVDGTQSRPFELKWTSRPQAIVYKTAYILAFTNDAIEVATQVNGNLVKSVQLPQLTFISSKNDVFFSSRSYDNRSFSIFKMSADSLSGRAQTQDLSVLPVHITGTHYARKLSTSEFNTAISMHRRINSSPSKLSNSNLKKAVEAADE